LTRREAEVLAWVSEGKRDAEIATILSTSTRTVHKHVQRILAKTGADTRTAAVASWRQSGARL
jgi:DNA-binding CsgD family transcriptional regulator